MRTKTLKLIIAAVVSALFLTSCNNKSSFEKQRVISEYYNNLTPDQQDSLKVQLSKLCR